jgi:hypothetical protein
MQAAVHIPTLDALASEEAARGRKGAMPSLKSEGPGAGKPGEPLRRVRSERKDAFVRVYHLIAAIGGEGNHGNGARWGAGWRRWIKDGRKSRNCGRRRTRCWRRDQRRQAHLWDLEKRQREASDLLLQGEDLELHLSQLREDIRWRQWRGRGSLGGKGGRQMTTVGIS